LEITKHNEMFYQLKPAMQENDKEVIEKDQDTWQ
jgi:hypothetical protein